MYQGGGTTTTHLENQTAFQFVWLLGPLLHAHQIFSVPAVSLRFLPVRCFIDLPRVIRRSLLKLT